MAKLFFTCPECGTKYQTTNKIKTCYQCRDRNGENNPFFGRHHSDQTKAKLKAKMSGKKPINTQKVLINNTVYSSMSDAAKDIGVVTATISNRIKSKKFPNYTTLP